MQTQQRNLTYLNLKNLIKKLNITGMSRFYYLRNFYDIRCKYEQVLFIIHY